MHESVIEFVRKHLYPNEVKGKRILEVGSKNINGSVRPIVEAHAPLSYVGIDIEPGQGVDLVTSVEALYAASPTVDYDVVVSCEMLEHAQDWRAALRAMCDLAGETLILTARGPGFPYHNPPDYWRFRQHDLWRAVEDKGLRVVHIQEDPQVPGVFLKAISYGTLIDPEKIR